MGVSNLNGGGYRVDWIDSLKGFAILFVVLGHVLLGYGENYVFPENINAVVLFLKDWIYTWHMPLFFAISGYTFRLAYIENQEHGISIKKDKVIKQAINLLLIYLIFQVTLCILKTVFSAFVDNPMNYSELLENILIPNNIMWYLWVLIIYYIIFSIIVSAKLKIGKAFLTVTLAIAFLKIGTSEWISWGLAVGNLLRNMFSFSLGIYFVENTVKLQRSQKRIVLTLVIIMSILFLYTDNAEPILSGAISEILALTVILFLFDCFKQKNKEGKILKALGRHSMVIYLLHTYFVTAIKVVCIRMGICSTFTAVPVILLTMIIPIIFTYGIAVFCENNKYLSWIFRPILLLRRWMK